MKVYEKIPVAKVNRSRHNLSYTKKLTGQMGKLYPTLCEEMVPGDIWKIRNAHYIEFLPLVGPLMDNIYMKTYYFFTPYRILDEHFEDIFMKRILDPTTKKYRELKDTDNVSVPKWKNGNESQHVFSKYSLGDYALGLVAPTVPVEDCPIDYPRRAYNLIWNEWFRDEKLQAEVDLANENILRKCWSKDYFTSASISAQFGDPVALPLSGFAPLTDYLVQTGSGFAEYLKPRQGTIGDLGYTETTDQGKITLSGSQEFTTFGNSIVLHNTDTTNAWDVGYYGTHHDNWQRDSWEVYTNNAQGQFTSAANTLSGYCTGNSQDKNVSFIGNNFIKSGTFSNNSTVITYPTNANSTDRNFLETFNGTLNGYLGIFGVNSEDFTSLGSNTLKYTKELYANRQLPRQLVADLSTAGTFDIKDLRLANALQRWKELMNTSGLRYVEYLTAQYGQFLRDERAQRPIYLGSTSSKVMSSSVIQTDPDGSGSENPTAPGTRAGVASGSGSGSIGTFHAKECGVLYGLTVVYPEHNYMQGLHKQWTKDTFYDFFNPLFECIGDEEILEKEIYITANTTVNNRVFGYQGRNNHMRSRQNMLTSGVRDDFLYRTFTDVYSNAPNLNGDFITINPSRRPFAYQDDTSDDFLLEFGNIIKAIRPIDAMPNYHL